VSSTGFATWLDQVPSPQDVRQSLQHAAGLPDQARYLARADGDARFALWLRLADQHAAAALRETRRPAALSGPQFPWRGAYVSCWSPRGAAEAAHAGADHGTLLTLREVERTGRPVTAAPTDLEPGLPRPGGGPQL
jgi:hypothetical protein